ncbi:MAG: Spy/CpxP family protein refolding chaperone [Glaciimonas sp.]|nr:Spy/CpxP family protein refolding chaperone [Glaciimonas sp.]
MKTSARRASLFAGFYLATAGIYSHAQGTQTEATASNKQSHYQWNDPVSSTRRYVAELNKKLGLKPAQQGAWETFSAALMTLKKEEAQLGEKARAATPADFENVTTPEKIAKMSAVMRLSAESLRRTSHIVKDFYNVLSVEQKSIFDLSSIKAWNI